MNEQRMWAVKDPEGEFDTAATTRRRAICLAAPRLTHEQSMRRWKCLYRQGYRCVRVVVREEEACGE